MAARAFSTSTRGMSQLDWKLKGTTQNVRLYQLIVEAAIDQVPKYAKVKRGQIQGDPHLTGDVPLHTSGQLGSGSLKGSSRATSFHAFPDGLVQFSDPEVADVRVDASIIQQSLDSVPQASEKQSGYEQTPAHQAAGQKATATTNAPAGSYWDGQYYVSTENSAYVWVGSNWVPRP